MLEIAAEWLESGKAPIHHHGWCGSDQESLAQLLTEVRAEALEECDTNWINQLAQKEQAIRDSALEEAIVLLAKYPDEPAWQLLPMLRKLSVSSTHAGEGRGGDK